MSTSKTAARRHGLGATKRRAIVSLFLFGFSPKSVARLFSITVDEVYQAIRRNGRGR